MLKSGSIFKKSTRFFKSYVKKISALCLEKLIFTWNDSPCVLCWLLSDPLDEWGPATTVCDVKRHVDPSQNIWVVDIGVDARDADTSATSAERSNT